MPGCSHPAHRTGIQVERVVHFRIIPPVDSKSKPLITITSNFDYERPGRSLALPAGSAPAQKWHKGVMLPGNCKPARSMVQIGNCCYHNPAPPPGALLGSGWASGLARNGQEMRSWPSDLEHTPGARAPQMKVESAHAHSHAHERSGSQVHTDAQSPIHLIHLPPNPQPARPVWRASDGHRHPSPPSGSTASWPLPFPQR